MTQMTHGARNDPRDTIVLAIILIAVGAGALMLQVFPDQGALVVVVIGLALLGLFGATGAYGALIPGAIMTGLGLGILVEQNLPLADPADGGVIVLGLGLGFLAIWVIGAVAHVREHHVWPLIPGGILAVIGIMLMIGGVAVDLLQFWPLVLIALGVVVLWRAWAASRPS